MLEVLGPDVRLDPVRVQIRVDAGRRHGVHRLQRLRLGPVSGIPVQQQPQHRVSPMRFQLPQWELHAGAVRANEQCRVPPLHRLRAERVSGQSVQRHQGRGVSALHADMSARPVRPNGVLSHGEYGLRPVHRRRVPGEPIPITAVHHSARPGMLQVPVLR